MTTRTRLTEDEQIQQNQFRRGYADAIAGLEYGRSNESGTLCKAYQEAYELGWKAGRSERHD